jgi:hypothetical protein
VLSELFPITHHALLRRQKRWSGEIFRRLKKMDQQKLIGDIWWLYILDIGEQAIDS